MPEAPSGSFDELAPIDRSLEPAPARAAREPADAAAAVREDVREQLRALERARADAVAAREEAEAARREAEEARRAAEIARAAAESASRAKSEFLATMSHELRTPLNAIAGYAELLRLGIHGPVTPDQTQALERIQRSQRHLLGLINEVLNYARVESGIVQYAVEDVPMDEVLGTCEALTAPQLRAKRLHYRYAGEGPALTARADREKVQQVVLNLLSNAVKFTEPGGRVSLECEADERTVRVRVVDTGRGIPADQLDRIFQPFVQVRSEHTRPNDGVGLGLAISRDLARGMAGDLTVESELGAGSTFTLTLPRA